MATTFNVLDLIFFAFTIIFVTTAFFRGFVKEIFALCAWVLAFLASYFLAPIISKAVASHFSNRLVLEIVMQLVIFMAVFIIFNISTSGLCDEMKHKISHVLDRSLGIFYGLVKTLIVFGFIYALSVNILMVASGASRREDPKKFLPAWFREAKCHNLIRISGETLDFPVRKLLGVFTKGLEKKMPSISDFGNSFGGLDEKIDELNKTAESISGNQTSDELDDQLKDSGYNGYSKKDLEKMNHLIEIIDKK